MAEKQRCIEETVQPERSKPRAAEVACAAKAREAWGCSCCGLSGRSVKIRVGLLAVLIVVVVVLLVHGFTTAG